jgi:hypothetical protein
MHFVQGISQQSGEKSCFILGYRLLSQVSVVLLSHSIQIPDPASNYARDAVSTSHI